MVKFNKEELNEFTHTTASIAELKEDLTHITAVVFNASLKKGVTRTTLNIDLLHNISSFLDLFKDGEED